MHFLKRVIQQVTEYTELIYLMRNLSSFHNVRIGPSMQYVLSFEYF